MLLRSFRSDQSGNFAMTAALCIMPIMLGAGIAIDYSMAFRYQARLQNAVDTATLAAGIDMVKLKDGQIRTEVKDYLKANMDPRDHDQIDNVNVEIDRKNMTLKVTVLGGFETSFAGIIGLDELPYKGVASIQRHNGSLEAVLVLDNTASMLNDGKLDALKVASTAFVTEMIDNAPTGKLPKIGIVPFSNYVNVGTDNRNASWMTVPADETKEVCGETRDVISKSGCSTQTGTASNDGTPYTYQYETCTNYQYGPPRNVCSMQTSQWHGCAGSRDYPRNLSDGSYGTRIPGIMDSSTVNYQCPSRVTELTTNKNSLLAQISGMQAVGNTYIPSGMVWGWRVITSKAPFAGGATPAQVAKGEIKKAVILMTDGQNTLSKNPNDGYHWSSDSAQADQWTLEVCQNVKDDKVIIYTMAFGAEVPATTKQMLAHCSSGAGHFFDASNQAELTKAFADIAADLNKLYLTQ